MVNATSLTQKRQDLREALIIAAARVISGRGYQALRARDLAQDVGCAVGAIYNVFPDMDALNLAVKSRALDELQGDILGQLGPDETATREEGVARLMALSRIYLEFAHRNRRLWLSAFEHSSAVTPIYEAYMLRLDNIFANVERPLIVILPNMPSPERKLLARALFSAVHGVISLGLVEKLGSLSLEELRWQTRVVLAATLRGMEEAASGSEPVACDRKMISPGT
jgi:AcrR family transcriptional regulator